MLILTGNVTPNYTVERVYGYATRSIVAGVSFVSEWFGNWSNFFGSRSKTFEKEYDNAKNRLLNEFIACVKSDYPTSNAIINFNIEYEPVNLGRGVMFMLIAQGTVVMLRHKE